MDLIAGDAVAGRDDVTESVAESVRAGGANVTDADIDDDEVNAFWPLSVADGVRDKLCGVLEDVHPLVLVLSLVILEDEESDKLLELSGMVPVDVGLGSNLVAVLLSGHVSQIAPLTDGNSRVSQSPVEGAMATN